jgi:hypothetical protein
MFYVGWGSSRNFTQATKATVVLEWRFSFGVDSVYQTAKGIHVGGCEKQLVQGIFWG